MVKKTPRPNAHTPKGFKRYPAKAKRLIADNKRVFIALVIGIAIMLPTGVYVGAIRNKQEPTKTTTPNSTTTQTKEQTKDTKKTTETKTTTEQGTSQSNNSQPTTTNSPTPTTTTTTPPPASTTPEYVYEKPQCSSTLRASTIATLKQGYQTQANRKSMELGAWYSNNYQLPTYTHQQFVDREAQNQAWLDNYIAIEIANANTSLNEYWTCTAITRTELGV